MIRRSIWLVFLIGALLFMTAFGQPEEDWNKAYGGVGNDCGNSVQKSGSEYIVAGYTTQEGNRDVYLLKLHSDGEVDWERSLGEQGDDMGWTVLKVTDGYVIAGATESYGSEGKDVLLIRTDLDGEEKWHQHFGGPGDQWGISLLKDGDGYVIAGVSESQEGIMNGYVIKTDLDGNMEWDRDFGGSKSDIFNSVQEADEGYILTGSTESYGSGGKDIWLVKTDVDGREVWNRQFGGSADDMGNSVAEVKDGYVIAGVTESSGSGKRDLLLIKADLDGNQVWDSSIGGSGDDGGWSIEEAGDGYLVAGYTESEGSGDQDMWLLKTDSDGKEVWSQTFGESGFDLCRSLLKDGTKNYLMVGWTESKGAGCKDVWLVKAKEE